MKNNIKMFSTCKNQTISLFLESKKIFFNFYESVFISFE